MEDVLKRLLDAEVKAEAMVRDSEVEYDRIIQATKDEIQEAEKKFDERVPELRAASLESAAERAEQTIAELKRRYDERQREQHAIAEDRAADALDAALALILDPARG